MDSKDCTIMNILLENSRLSYREIAKKAGCSVVTIINRIHELEKNGIIKGYTATLDYEKIGYDVTALIKLRISKGKLIEVEKKIAIHPNVSAIYDLTGDFDSVIIVRFKDRRTMDLFL